MYRHYRRALGALLVYDITKSQTFESLKSWLDNLKTHAEADIVIMLVGNKLDEVKKQPDARQVPRDVAEEFAEQEKLKFIETSAHENNNVKEAFENLLQEIYV
jgi:small GTP-binding protein